MLEEVPENKKNWQRHWFVVNVLFEIPVVGSFLKKKTLASAIHDAGKCISAAAGGIAGMNYNLIPNEDDDSADHIAKMTINMLIGMTVGKVAYNAAFNSCAILYQYVESKNHSEPNARHDHEMQPINTAIDNKPIARLPSIIA